MDLESLQKAEQELSSTALFDIVQQMKSDFEQKISKLETELSTFRNQEQLNSNTTPTQTTARPILSTTRRRLLKTMAASAVGVAAFSYMNLSTAQAQVFTSAPLDFNGYPKFPADGENSAVLTTTIKPNLNATGGKATYNTNSPVPLLTIDNNANAVTTGSTPEALPLALYARSNSSFAIYGYSAANAAGVVGLSQNVSLPTGAFYSGQVGGVVGASNQNSGVVGMSPSREGVLGLSTGSAGVAGVSQAGIGGIFGFENATNTSNVGSGIGYDQGAAMRLGLRNSFTAPNTTSFSHNPGEIVLDKVSRVFICNTGFTVPTGQPETNATPPGAFYPGPFSPTAASWRTLPHMKISATSPVLNGSGQLQNDTELHSTGELWLDVSTGKLFACTVTGSNDSNILNSVGINPNQKPVFRPVANGLQFLPYPDRWLDTYTGTGFSGTSGQNNGAPPDRQLFNVQITGVGGLRGGAETLIPVGAQAVFGTVMVLKGVAPTNIGLIKVLPGGFADPLNKGTSSAVFRNGGDAFAPIFIKLDTQGRLSFIFINGTVQPLVADSKVVIDIVAYVP